MDALFSPCALCVWTGFESEFWHTLITVTLAALGATRSLSSAQHQQIFSSRLSQHPQRPAWHTGRLHAQFHCVPPIKAPHGVSETPCADFHGGDLLPSRPASARLVMGTPCTGRIFYAGRQVDGSAARWGSHVGSIAQWKHRGRRATLATFVDEQTKRDEMVEK